MKNQTELKQLIEEREQFIQAANERIAWYNGRIHQLRQQSALRRWWQAARRWLGGKA